MRHAKSSWKHDLPDDKRPLKPRGLNDAKLVSSQFKNYNIMPDLILSSHAERAKKTAEICLNNLGIDRDNLKIEKKLYDFSGEKVTNVIKNTSDEVTCLMIFGHNYAFTNFVNTYGDLYIDNVPTSGLTCIEFSIDSWKDLEPGKTLFTVYPRDFK